jgi:peptidoglycan/xylan/chitin deacetylase (PgdA/CDA1 family)
MPPPTAFVRAHPGPDPKTVSFAPPYIWPDNRRCCVSITVDVDAVTPMMWRQRHDRAYPLAEVEQRSFGVRQGVDRFLHILSDLEVRATFFVPGYIAETHRELIQAIGEQGHEVGLHGYLHEAVDHVDEEGHREILRKSIGILGGLLGRAPVGYRSPNWGMTEFLPDLLREHHVEYDSSLMGFDHPYIFRGLVEVPVSWAAHDAPYFFYSGADQNVPPWPAGQLAQAWRDEAAAAWRFSSLFCLTLHPWMSGRGHRAIVIERIVRDLRRDPLIWVATCQEIAAYHLQSPNRERFLV